MFSATRHSRFIRHAPLQPPLVGFIGRGAAASIVVQTAADCSSMARHWHTVALQVYAVRACSLGGGHFKRLLGRAVTMGDFRWRGQKPLGPGLPEAWAAGGPGRPGPQGRGRPPDPSLGPEAAGPGASPESLAPSRQCPAECRKNNPMPTGPFHIFYSASFFLPVMFTCERGNAMSP